MPFFLLCLFASLARGDVPSAKLTLVLELDAGHGVAAELAHTLSEAVLADIRQVSMGKVLGANDIKSLLGFERQRTLLGCKDHTECYAEIGSAMGAKEIVTGSIATVGDTYLLVLRRVDVTHTQVLREGTRTRQTSDQAGLLLDLQELAKLLFATQSVAPVSPAIVTAPPVASTVGALQASYRAGCDKQDGMACYNLGTLVYGDDPAAAAALFRKGCDLKAPLGCFRAAFIYLTGAKGLRRDQGQAMLLLRLACDASTGKGQEGRALDGACTALSAYLLNGIGVPADPARAIGILKRLCDRGNDDGCANLAKAEIHGPASVRNVAHGKAMSKDLCDQGQTSACSDAQ